MRSPISPRFGPAPTWLLGYSLSCAINSARNTASAGAKLRMSTGAMPLTLVSDAEQTSRVEFEELRAALAELPTDQRQALIFVRASDYSYEDAAVICGCAPGTVKSRVHRDTNTPCRPARHGQRRWYLA